jgi:hypothetical protein
MHGWGSYHHYHRGGSRILWFILGASAASWHYHSKEAREREGGWGCTWRHRRELEALRAAGAGESAPPELERWAWQAKWGSHPNAQPVPGPAPAPTQAVDAVPALVGPPAVDWEALKRERWSRENEMRTKAANEWAVEQERLRDLAKNAEEKVHLVSFPYLAALLLTNIRRTDHRLLRGDARLDPRDGRIAQGRESRRTVRTRSVADQRMWMISRNWRSTVCSRRRRLRRSGSCRRRRTRRRRDGSECSAG